MTIFDSNLWIAAYYPEDSTHQKAIETLQKHKDKFFLTESIISEVITVLKRFKDIQAAKRFVRLVYSNADFMILTNDEYYQDTIDYFLNSNNTKLSFVDMSLVVLSKKYRIESFDKDLQNEIKTAR